MLWPLSMVVVSALAVLIAVAFMRRGEAEFAKNIWRNVAIVSVAAWVILGGAYLIGKLGHSDIPQQDASTEAMINGMVAKLQAKLDANPTDVQGWRMMGIAQLNLQHFDQSVAAYQKAMALDPADVDTQSRFVEALVQQAQGTVTPQARDVIAAVLAKQPKDLRTRFYQAMGIEQAGDKAGALEKWQSLLADAPADAPWRESVRNHIAELTKK